MKVNEETKANEKEKANYVKITTSSESSMSANKEAKSSIDAPSSLSSPHLALLTTKANVKQDHETRNMTSFQQALQDWKNPVFRPAPPPDLGVAVWKTWRRRAASCRRTADKFSGFGGLVRCGGGGSDRDGNEEEGKRDGDDEDNCTVDIGVASTRADGALDSSDLTGNAAVLVVPTTLNAAWFSQQIPLKVSKQELKSSSRVLSQVDKKFILVRVARSTSASLLLVDQHAADERVQYELLLAKLCYNIDNSTLAKLDKLKFSQGVVKPLKPAKQCKILRKSPITLTFTPYELSILAFYVQHFATWSITYAFISSNQLAIITLPRVIAQRCIANPQLIVDIIRDEITHLIHSPPLPMVASAHDTPSSISCSPTWVRLIQNCPVGLLNMLKSRACRTAIMFNDELSKHQCCELISNLSNCVFPFHCAHGRPSIVPILDIPY